MNVIASGRERVYPIWFLSLLETGASTADDIGTMSLWDETQMSKVPLSYGNRTELYD
jgi:hypothetical protein